MPNYVDRMRATRALIAALLFGLCGCGAVEEDPPTENHEQQPDENQEVPELGPRPTIDRDVHEPLRYFESEEEFLDYMQALADERLWDLRADYAETGNNWNNGGDPCDLLGNPDPPHGRPPEDGVSHGDVTQSIGNHLFVLDRSSVHSLRVEPDGELTPIDTIAAGPPEIEGRFAPEEMLVHDGSLYLVGLRVNLRIPGLSYGDGCFATEIVRIDAQPDGILRHGASARFHRTRDYGSREPEIRAGKLVFASGFDAFTVTAGDAPTVQLVLPALLDVNDDGSLAPGRPLFTWDRVTRPFAPPHRGGFHGVVQCDLAGGMIACSADVLATPGADLEHASLGGGVVVNRRTDPYLFAFEPGEAATAHRLGGTLRSSLSDSRRGESLVLPVLEEGVGLSLQTATLEQFDHLASEGPSLRNVIADPRLDEFDIAQGPNHLLIAAENEDGAAVVIAHRFDTQEAREIEVGDVTSGAVWHLDADTAIHAGTSGSAVRVQAIDLRDGRVGSAVDLDESSTAGGPKRRVTTVHSDGQRFVAINTLSDHQPHELQLASLSDELALALVGTVSTEVPDNDEFHTRNTRALTVSDTIHVLIGPELVRVAPLREPLVQERVRLE